MKRIVRLPKNSKYVGNLPEGCRYCAKGQKMVLLVTGLCSAKCFYCPLSFEKKGRDVVFANEKFVENDDDIIFESKSIDGKGAGITGGDPLEVKSRTFKYIRLLKNVFGSEYHIHLYTANPSISTVRNLAAAGLDELRIHIPSHKWSNYSKYINVIKKAVDTGMDVGVELPVIPGLKAELTQLIKNVDRMGIQFVNLNELEFSETNWRILKNRGYKPKSEISNAVKDSESTALDILNIDVTCSMHYCSASFKDSIQLRNRILRRANHVKKKSDIVMDDGMLLKGVIECSDLEKTYTNLMKNFGIPEELVHIDTAKNRIEIAAWILEEISSFIEYECYIVIEYPTADRLEVEKWKL
jgi:hypothetical protein